jgi:hypothetical protein
MKKQMLQVIAGCCLFLFANESKAQNPLITNQYTADPSARVFGDKVYVFPSHDILASPGKGRPGWFCMEDYHVFSSGDLTNWKDHGVIVEQNKVPWVRPNSYSMWAPDCIERNGKYYFYFPTSAKDTVKHGRGFTIGVAVADKPEGPYLPQPEPIAGVRGIDPNVFIDKDGQAYMYWSQGNIYGAKLKENMLELDGEVKTLGELPTKGLKEGPYLFEKNGTYYLTYPHVENKTERLEYAIGNNPLGPFKFTGVIMEETPGCWTNHHSILPFKNQWYLFYHSNDLSPAFDKARSIRADSLFFNADGTIKKVVPTLRGIGVTAAKSRIQVDRYSNKSGEDVLIDFIDTANKFLGWKALFNKQGAWLQYNTVDFTTPVKKLVCNVSSASGGKFAVYLDQTSGQPIAEINIPATGGWKEISVPVKSVQKGKHAIIVQQQSTSGIALDWIQFQ